MKKEIRLVLFDIGGVLLRTDDPAPRTRLAQRYGLDRAGIDRLVFSSPAAQAAEIGRAEESAVWAHVGETLGIDAAEMVEFQRQFWAGDTVDLSLFDLLRSLRPARRTGLLTNSWLREPLALFRTRYGLADDLVRDAVEAAVSSAQVGVQKPDRRIFDTALARFNAAAEETVFVDDFVQNVEAARKLGMVSILFENPTQARRDLLAALGG